MQPKETGKGRAKVLPDDKKKTLDERYADDVRNLHEAYQVGLENLCSVLDSFRESVLRVNRVNWKRLTALFYSTYSLWPCPLMVFYAVILYLFIIAILFQLQSSYPYYCAQRIQFLGPLTESEIEARLTA